MYRISTFRTLETAFSTAFNRGRGVIGQVTKILSGAYRITADGADYKGVARGKLKRSGELYVGDNVEFSLSGGVAFIEASLDRKTVLLRPYVANVDTVLTVVAPVPEPELLLVDKIVLNALSAGVAPVLVYNKRDITELPDELLRAYKPVLPVFSVSSATGAGLDALTSFLSGKTAAFAGQSAVGKTSLLNALFERSGFAREKEKVGELSKKSRQGKNTTRHVELYDFGCFKLVDTCGFNVLECAGEDERALADYYEEYRTLADGCRFRGCSHIAEPDCRVKEAVEAGRLDMGRYERYCRLYAELKKKRGEKYD